MTISALSILCMTLSALISIGVPVGLWIYYHKRYGAKIVPALTGAAAFLIFAMGLEQVMHMLVLKPQPDGSTWLTGYPVAFMLYGAFAAGIFEETGRFFSFKLLKRRYGGIRTALSYGVGHGGIEAILLGGASMIASIVMSVLVNAGQAATLTAGENGALVSAQLSALAATPPALFLVAGIERMLALTIHISLSVLVYYSVYQKGSFWLYPAAILLHAAVDMLPALAKTGVVTNVLVIEGVVFLMSVALALLAVYTHRRLKPEAEEGATPHPEREAQ